jgi:hypothetical protein
MRARRFPLGDILTVTTGVAFTQGMAGAHELMEFMVGGPVWTHQLPRIADECKPELLRQHPDLAGVQPPDEFPEPVADNALRWLADQVARFGEYRTVAPLAAGHPLVNPVSDLINVWGAR